ncbi:hypothetical protein TRFO_01703 [Tritrichomonas foetus]|uniref:Leucine Rich Repeat family protein n=1 Tax=Tritrichomonas foetus TaxID=1144522 RepID=A0A1J4JPT2_9EUKA|nr:hypothetical protein TRFO_01703 [Tritrichomonas foetus]|eukprot:OHT01113.1 hypothetical protein TRFO_01703 [Tritrichomonas foetus]
MKSGNQTKQSPYPKKLIVPNQKLHQIPIPKNPTRISFIDFSNNPIKSLSNLPQITTLEKLSGDDTKINSFYGVVEQPHLTSLSLFNTPISQCKYFKLMASIAFGHALKIVNDDPLTIRDLDDQFRYGPIIRKHLVQGYIIESLTPTIDLRSTIDNSRLTLLYKPSKSYFDINDEEEDIDDVVLSAFKSAPRRVSRDPVDILNYHKAALEKFQSCYSGKRVPFPSPQQDVGMYDLPSDESPLTETESVKINEIGSTQKVEEMLFQFSD